MKIKNIWVIGSINKITKGKVQEQEKSVMGIAAVFRVFKNSSLVTKPKLDPQNSLICAKLSQTAGNFGRGIWRGGHVSIWKKNLRGWIFIRCGCLRRFDGMDNDFAQQRPMALANCGWSEPWE
jgi:hypothetical protein